MKKLIGILLMATVIATLPLEHAFARGFGGFRGSGGFGGGFGGGFSDRSFGGGGSFGGGFSDRSFSGNWGGDRSSWGGDRSNWGGFRQEGAQRRFDGGADRFRSDRPERPRPSESPRPDGEGDRWGRLPNRDFSGVSRSRLNSFLGMPTDAGVGHVAGVSGTRVTAGRIEGPRGGEAAFASATHVRYIPPEQQRNQAWNVRNNFNNYNVFTRNWWRDHPGAWAGAGIAAAAWAGASWANASDWVGCDAPPEDYDYGSSVLYQGGNVYVEGQPAGTDAQYYDQASSLASSSQDKKDEDGGWLSLGVFGMVQGQQTDPTVIFQLAVNHDGTVRGNYYNTLTNTTLPVHGAVDKKTQRVAWTVGDNKTTIYDTGLYNLTKDQAPALVHMGKDKTQEWLMVRLTSKDQQAKGAQGS